MQFLEVCLTVSIGGQPLQVRVVRTPSELYIVTGKNKIHRVEKTRKCWKTDSRMIVLYIDDIREKYLETTNSFKWDLPKKLKDVIYMARIDMDARCLTFWLQYPASAQVFEELLSRHLIYRQIKPWIPVTVFDLYNDKSIALDLHLKNAKGHFRLTSPVTDNDLEKLVDKPDEGRKS